MLCASSPLSSLMCSWYRGYLRREDSHGLGPGQAGCRLGVGFQAGVQEARGDFNVEQGKRVCLRAQEIVHASQDFRADSLHVCQYVSVHEEAHREREKHAAVAPASGLQLRTRKGPSQMQQMHPCMPTRCAPMSCAMHAPEAADVAD
jgi:hypothetical protein